ncbi:MAG TPA: UvrD-helicase domain-containing protein, partial [Solirubrobacteraceae bacterium]|nr:UvrD-helicase domain-containing protein [Solirubrobacteraceae bacterium]
MRGVSVVEELIGPSGRPFTDEQAAAVLRREGDLLLSAAAGSGKTSVLVERFVRLVTEDGFKPGQILAITFTEKAAGELRHRVRSRLLELGERDLAREAEGAWISTIHGFCARLLRGHAVAAGLDPAFAVLDETVARGLRNQAWDTAFASWLSERGDAALDLAAAFTADRLREAIEDVYAVLRSEGHTHPRLAVPAPAPVPDPAALLDAREVALGSLDGGDTRATVLKALRALERCRELFATLAPGGVPDPGSLAQACFKPGSTKALKTDEIAGYLAAHETYAGACAAYRSSRAAAELDALLDRYARAYAEAKRARSGLDFDDLELLARDLMVESPAVRRATQERFARVMVDEFQDSSPRQVTLFDLVASGNLFVVGDELQSIYGFRHADVEVFRARRAMLTTTERALALTRNFRSRAPVLEAVNAAFADRFGPSFMPLVPGRGDAADGAPEVEVLITGADGWEDVDLGALPRAQAWRHAEARLLGQRLRELVDSGTPPEDIVVLLRSATDLPVYERALEEAGLQTLAAGGRGYWGRQVVRDLCAWLAALANPSDEEQLYGVLASPLVGLSTDALALLAGAGEGRVWQVIDAAFGGAPVPPPAPDDEADLRRFLRARELAGRLPELLPDGDRERLAAFRARFAHERRVLPSLPMDAVLRRAIEASDYDLHVLRLPGGARRLANVHKLLRLTADHERVHGRDVRGLVDRANEELEADARETDAPVELGDARAIRIMTMHAAKGLEFPVVAVTDLGRGPRGQYPPVLVGDGRLGIRLPSVGGGSEKGLAYGELRDERRAADAAEENRVLYVALTRARERLILSGTLRVDPWPDPARPNVAPLAWLAPALAGGLSP